MKILSQTKRSIVFNDAEIWPLSQVMLCNSFSSNTQQLSCAEQWQINRSLEGHKHNSVYFSVYSKAIQNLLKTYTSGSLLSAHKYYCLRGITLIVCLSRLVSATYKIARAPNILLVVLQIWRMLQPMAFYFIRELTPNYITLSIFFTCCETSFAKKRCMLLLTAA